MNSKKRKKKTKYKRKAKDDRNDGIYLEILEVREVVRFDLLDPVVREIQFLQRDKVLQTVTDLHDSIVLETHDPQFRLQTEGKKGKEGKTGTQR